MAPSGGDDAPLALSAAVVSTGSTQEPRGAESGPAYVFVPELPAVRRRTPPLSLVRRRQRRRARWRLALALPAALATGAGIYALTASRHDSETPNAAPDPSSKTSPQAASSPPASSTATPTEDAKTGEETDAESTQPTPAQSPTLHWTGVVDALTDKQGIDLDNGRILDQDAPGVDISLYGQASHIGAMDLAVSYAVLPEHTKPENHECQRAANWARLYADVYSLGIGRVICFKTDQQRLSAMVIEKPANATTGTIGFRYYTWETTR